MAKTLELNRETGDSPAADDVFDFSMEESFKKYTDITVVLADDEYRAHRILLAGSSPFFARRLTGDTFDLRDFDRATFDLYYHFVLFRSLEPTIEFLPSIMKIATALDVKAMIGIVRQFLETSMNPTTYLEILKAIGEYLTLFPSFASYAANQIESTGTKPDLSFLTQDSLHFLNSFYSNEVCKESNESFQTTDGPGLFERMADKIDVTSSGMLNGRNPRTLVESDPIRHWFTESDGNAWVMFTFKSGKVRPSAYAIWSHSGSSTIRNWQFQGSEDKKTWKVLSSHTNDMTVMEPYSSHVWPISSNESFKYFRVIQTGPNWADNIWLYLLKVDLWGDYTEESI